MKLPQTKALNADERNKLSKEKYKKSIYTQPRIKPEHSTKAGNVLKISTRNNLATKPIPFTKPNKPKEDKFPAVRYNKAALLRMAARPNNVVLKEHKIEHKQQPKMYHSTPFIAKPIAVCKPKIPATNRLRTNVIKKTIIPVAKPSKPIHMKPPAKPLSKPIAAVIPIGRRNMRQLTVPVPFSFENRYKKPTTNRW